MIHNIENDQFRSRFDADIAGLHGRSGIGVISDTDSQPLLIQSHLGRFAIVTVGAVKNADQLVTRAFQSRRVHFSEITSGEISPTELVATLIDQEESFEAGIVAAQELVEGSCSLLLLTEKGIYASRDRWGRTPVVIGRKEGAWAVARETCSFPNLGIATERYLGPGEIVLMTADGIERKAAPRESLQICAFLWVYYGYPASSYEGINVEWVRNECGAHTTLKYQRLDDLVAAIGLPKEKVCTYCWDGQEVAQKRIPF